MMDIFQKGIILTKKILKKSVFWEVEVIVL